MNFIQSILAPTSRSAAAFGLGNATSLSGGEQREDGKWSYGFSLLRGKRPYMEDFHSAQFKKIGSDTYGLFGVFDGHGGPNAADYVRSNFFLNLLQHPKFSTNIEAAVGELLATVMIQHPKFSTDIQAAVVDTYERTDVQYLRQETSSGRDDGCTGVTAIMVGNRLLVANAGDSRAVLCRGGTAIGMSIDHKPNSKEERARIEAAGGVVIWAGTWRVGGVLAVSRAFGDRPLKKFVIPTPAVFNETLGSEDEFLLMASDGLWDVINNQEAVTLIRGIPDGEKAARRLTEEAFKRGSNDNISALVIRFKP
eukprot:gene14538-20578_t